MQSALALPLQLQQHHGVVLRGCVAAAATLSRQDAAAAAAYAARDAVASSADSFKAPPAISPLKDSERDILITGFSEIFRFAVKNRVPAPQLKEALVELRFPDLVVDEMVKLYEGNRSGLETRARVGRERLPSIAPGGLAWRVDVEIATNLLARSMQTSLHLSMTTTDGKIRQIAVPMAQFHKLRQSVAKALKDLDEMSQLQVLKIDK
eukprot:TRINITY_DN22844_c0_g1_i1.p1 TRINITY_DN22844_c0_g1~~TRINITY_DN22844_c0_g1_i1.p1  ORF type:complete len:208 (+),score=49.98 TRINITY_DN22844_c0_g1_i1:17-640(+)